MKTIPKLLVIAIFTLMISGLATNGEIINVPGDFPSIQEAINNASEGDTVLVAEGEYFENVNFMGKNIVLCSNYINSHLLSDIENTIINGSNPANSDTASCVLIVNGEDSTAVLRGFTITGGTGTLWEDEHGPGNFYIEGGGVLIQNSSPVISNNIFIDNEAIASQAGVVSAGGGAIRCGDGYPEIHNNIFTGNKGKYGGALVLNYSGAVIKNNIFAYNSGGQSFGGGGIWSYQNGDNPILIENNTIVYNHSQLGGGGIRLWSSTADLINNIIWGNTAANNAQIQGFSGNVTFCDVQGGWSGDGNIDENPNFIDNKFILASQSQCIDAGNPDSQYNDIEDNQNPGNALFPSQGTLRNDIGAYGGPKCILLSEIAVGNNENISPKQNDFLEVYPNPLNGKATIHYPELTYEATLLIRDMTGKIVYSVTKKPGSNSCQVDMGNLTDGMYILYFRSEDVFIVKKIVLQNN